MFNKRTLSLLILSVLCWIVQAKPDIIRRMIPFENATELGITT